MVVFLDQKRQLHATYRQSQWLREWPKKRADKIRESQSVLFPFSHTHFGLNTRCSHCFIFQSKYLKGKPWFLKCDYHSWHFKGYLFVVAALLKDLGSICWGRSKSLPADLKISIYELGEIWGQIFGVPKGTKEAHEVRFEIPQKFLRFLRCFAIYLRNLMHFRKKIAK